MKCSACGGDTQVTMTYQNADGRVRRRRECLQCKRRFTTRELEVDAEAQIQVKKPPRKPRVAKSEGIDEGNQPVV